MTITWVYEESKINWTELYELYDLVPMGKNSPEDLKILFNNSRFKCFVFDQNKIIGVGRALADGIDCSYICHVAVHPDYQGMGLGKKIIKKLVEFSKKHKKIILYANPGKEGFYAKLGFKKMNTAMAIFKNEEQMIKNGTLSET